MKERAERVNLLILYCTNSGALFCLFVCKHRTVLMKIPFTIKMVYGYMSIYNLHLINYLTKSLQTFFRKKNIKKSHLIKSVGHKIHRILLTSIKNINYHCVDKEQACIPINKTPTLYLTYLQWNFTYLMLDHIFLIQSTAKGSYTQSLKVASSPRNKVRHCRVKCEPIIKCYLALLKRRSSLNVMSCIGFTVIS